MRSPIHAPESRPLRRRGGAAALGALVLLVSGSAIAQTAGGPAERFPVWGTAVKTGEQLARGHWGMQACGGRVALSWRRLDPAVNATSRWWNPSSAYGDAAANTDCTTTLNANVDFDWPKLCTILVHEYGHLTGHPHSADPQDIMYPYYEGPVAECAATPEPHAARPRVTGSTGAVTAAVACGRRSHGRGVHAVHGLRACSAPPRRPPGKSS
jgi:matrixin